MLKKSELDKLVEGARESFALVQQQYKEKEIEKKLQDESKEGLYNDYSRKLEHLLG